MGKIILRVQADSYSEYETIAGFRLMLNGGFCTVNWGDGTTTTHHAEGEEQHIRHIYPKECLETEKTFVITISSDEDNIVGISAISESFNMDVKDIDISGCQSLRYFASLSASTEHFDLRTNPGITKVKLQGDFCGIADFSNSLELKELSIDCCFACSESEQLFELDLSQCSKLEKLKCTAIMEPINVKLPKYFPLKEFTYDESADGCFSKGQLKKIVNVVEQNNGKILRGERHLWNFSNSGIFLLPEPGNKRMNMDEPMRTQIKMTIRIWGDNKFTGYAGNVNVLLDGGSCHIDWGDGHTSELYANGREWLHGLHVYSAKCTSRQITISSDTGNIIGIIADDHNPIYSHIEAIDISGCQSLKYFGSTSAHFNLNGNPGIKAIDLMETDCTSINFSNSTGLENLNIQDFKGKQLDLTKCNKLEYLACYCNSELTDILVSDDSAMKTLIYEMTPLSDSSLDRLRKVINRNGGEIRKLETDDNEAENN